MKSWKWLAAIAAAILMITFRTSPAAANQVTGYLDQAAGQTVCGWAWDPDAPASAVDVQIRVKSTKDNSILYTQTCSADQYREDLHSFGNGCHAFTAALDLPPLPHDSYVIEAFCQDIPLTGTLYWQGASSPLQTLPAEAPETVQLTSLGVFRTTAYCSCRRCSGRWGRLTAAGTTAVSGHTVAVDPAVIPFGTKLMIDGVIYTAEDEGSGVNGNHIDIYCDTHAEAAAYGMQKKEVYLVHE